MPFKSGQSGNPDGRPKGAKSGRMQALGELDSLLKEAGVLASLREGLQKKLEQDPVWFFRRIVMPLLPREATLQLENDGVLQWRFLSDTVPVEDSLPFIEQNNASGLSAPDDDSERPCALPESS